MFAVIFALILMLVVILLDVGGKFMSWAFSFFTTGNGFLPILGDATDFSAMLTTQGGESVLEILVNSVIIPVGAGIVVLLLSFSLFKSILSDKETESPSKIIIRSGFALFFVFFSISLCSLLLNVTNKAQGWTNSALLSYAEMSEEVNYDNISNMATEAFPEEDGETEEDEDERSLAAGVLSCYIAFGLTWKFMKMVFQYISRYVRVYMLIIFAPLAGATYASESTEEIWLSYIKMFVSSLVSVAISMIFVLLMKISCLYTINETNNLSELILFVCFTMGLSHFFEDVDQYLEKVKLSIAGDSRPGISGFIGRMVGQMVTRGAYEGGKAAVMGTANLARMGANVVRGGEEAPDPGYSVKHFADTKETPDADQSPKNTKNTKKIGNNPDPENNKNNKNNKQLPDNSADTAPNQEPKPDGVLGTHNLELLNPESGEGNSGDGPNNGAGEETFDGKEGETRVSEGADLSNKTGENALGKEEEQHIQKEGYGTDLNGTEKNATQIGVDAASSSGNRESKADSSVTSGADSQEQHSTQNSSSSSGTGTSTAEAGGSTEGAGGNGTSVAKEGTTEGTKIKEESLEENTGEKGAASNKEKAKEPVSGKKADGQNETRTQQRENGQTNGRLPDSKPLKDEQTGRRYIDRVLRNRDKSNDSGSAHAGDSSNNNKNK